MSGSKTLTFLHILFLFAILFLFCYVRPSFVASRHFLQDHDKEASHDLEARYSDESDVMMSSQEHLSFGGNSFRRISDNNAENDAKREG